MLRRRSPSLSELLPVKLRDLFSDPDAGVLYVGASVTAQKDGYRSAFHSKLEEHVGHPVPMHVNALGGVGSLFGAANLMRFRREYASARLAILEYSTGDLNLWITPRNLVDETVRSLLTLLKAITPNVVVLHNYRSDFEGDKGLLVRGVYDRYAAEFDAHVVRMHSKVECLTPQLKATLYRDNVHSNSQGSMFVGEHLLDDLSNRQWGKQIERTSAYPTDPGFTFHHLTDTWPALESGSFIYRGTGQEFPYLELTVGDTLKLSITGDLLGVVSIVGPQSGYTSVETNSEVTILKTFDRNCYYQRPHCLPLSFNQAPQSLQLSVASDRVDVSLLKEPHPDVTKPRVARVSGFIGRKLQIVEAEVRAPNH
jgi:hypothetical protein